MKSYRILTLKYYNVNITYKKKSYHRRPSVVNNINNKIHKIIKFIYLLYNYHYVNYFIKNKIFYTNRILSMYEPNDKF